MTFFGHLYGYSLGLRKKKSDLIIDEDECFYISTQRTELLSDLLCLWIIQLLLATIPVVWLIFNIFYWLPHPNGILSRFIAWKKRGYSTAVFHLIIGMMFLSEVIVTAISGNQILMYIANNIF
jgi:hypothetical protein